MVVIAINAAMFVVETAAGAAADSRALQADALDFLADSLTYGLSLAVLGALPLWRARAALLKGFSLSLMGVGVLAATAHSVVVHGQPHAVTMGGIGLLALAANLASVLILMRYRDGDANVQSVWLCSRNDAIGNVAVMLSAAGVAITATPWPDLAVAAAMAVLFLSSSLQIIRRALAEVAAVRAVAAE
jgi:Co/Zn/Cd efflux system component